ncbi:hypothetical protein [Streptomyces sp. PT12]|uniref:hypothetical protein n=1 Tax=Streptomyces sp. PT12 TaxID=1510197 RepID=UPI0011BE9860|nr:hypothetical protein [Streptomyces sp. PT12]
MRRYRACADRLLPGRIAGFHVAGFHVVGSAALGAWREGRSDIEFVAVVCGSAPLAVPRLRVLHAPRPSWCAG